uniref:AMP-activated protein kinase glycogen-binding domain-containing protein n=1 Tax=Opuntia streptacantha TaxID=393608 RepID=A0A7C8YXV1_OPUST
MHAQSKLRSLRAKLAILEGKMALAIIYAQKILDEKQRRVNDARRALQLLRTICIVWPNSGSEVLLAGSFDGWATQRKMERSSTGIFSLQLKLYPGRYEVGCFVIATHFLHDQKII